jgi:hypothetical protein
LRPRLDGHSASLFDTSEFYIIIAYGTVAFSISRVMEYIRDRVGLWVNEIRLYFQNPFSNASELFSVIEVQYSLRDPSARDLLFK